MALLLHIYKEVEIVKESLREQEGGSLAVVTISYHGKPSLQALAVTTPDRPPVVGCHPSHLRDGGPLSPEPRRRTWRAQIRTDPQLSGRAMDFLTCPAPPGCEISAARPGRNLRYSGKRCRFQI